MAKEAVFCAKPLHFVWELGKMATVILVWMWARRPGKEWNMSEFRGSQNYVASEELMRAVNASPSLPSRTYLAMSSTPSPPNWLS